MKRMTFLALFVLVAGMVMAQTMYVHKTDGDVYEFKLSDVDSINFAASTIDDYLCTITYMPNGGEGVVVDTVVYGESYIVGACIQQEGYYIESWNTDPNGNGVAFKRGTVINSISRNITLYAQWRAYDGIENGYYYVDFGLPSGLKWAACNVGATKPEEYGNYYAWGETEPTTTYDWSTYKWCNGSRSTLTKYNTDSDYGTVDNKTVLELDDDAARANWGGAWRMPTDAEWTELRENCTWTWTSDYNGTGVAGRIVTSKTNGNHIFLPAAGYRYYDDLYAGYYGYYWSSSLDTDYPYRARGVRFYSDYVYGINYDRYYGYSVRPVL
ncbi:MAG: InlB B-repeat-containing protein [Paludibacteraceae bacterium]